MTTRTKGLLEATFFGIVALLLPALLVNHATQGTAPNAVLISFLFSGIVSFIYGVLVYREQVQEESENVDDPEMVADIKKCLANQVWSRNACVRNHTKKYYEGELNGK